MLKYFELELKMLTFDKAITFLKKIPKEVNEELLFNLIEAVSVTWKDFQTLLDNQKVADINTLIHQALLV